MSFLHLGYAGNFEKDGEWVRFAGTSNDPILKPVVRAPLNKGIVNELAAKIAGGGGGLPVTWHIWPEEGYLSFDRYKLTWVTLAFLKELVTATGCQLVDFNSRSEIAVEDLAPSCAKMLS